MFEEKYFFHRAQTLKFGMSGTYSGVQAIFLMKLVEYRKKKLCEFHFQLLLFKKNTVTTLM